jgi:RNA polymerase sigma factor (sigma-70 family)
MMELSTLVEHARQGDATALGHLVTEHWRFVYTICLSQVRQGADAEDLTQEVFVRVSQDLGDLREPDKFLPWLRQVTRNMCRMWRRRQFAGLEPMDAIVEVDDPAAATRFRRTELAEIVRVMLAQVSPKSREVLALHYLAGYSEAEIAVALGLRPATIKSRLREGREQAKRKLLPVVRELLALQRKPGCGCPLSQKMAKLTLAGYGKPGCGCPKALTDGR